MKKPSASSTKDRKEPKPSEPEPEDDLDLLQKELEAAKAGGTRAKGGTFGAVSTRANDNKKVAPKSAASSAGLKQQPKKPHQPEPEEEYTQRTKSTPHRRPPIQGDAVQPVAKRKPVVIQQAPLQPVLVLDQVCIIIDIRIICCCCGHYSHSLIYFYSRRRDEPTK